MIKFKENNIGILPYDREHYINFLDDDFVAATEWCAVSLQMINAADANINLSKFIDIFHKIFIKVISKIDDGATWIINHDDKDLKWFPNKNNNLKALRSIFKTNKIKESFVGSLILEKNDLIELAEDLISYPYILSYKNLDISYSKIPFIIKITSHLSIDLLSTDKELLKNVISEISSSQVILKEYRGTSLRT